MIQIPLEIGDIILTGRFKNKKVKVREIGTDDFGNPTVNGRSILKIRIPKLYQTQENTMKSNNKKSINERLHQHDTEVKIKNKDGKWWICTETDQGEEYLNSVGFDSKEAAEHSALTKGYSYSDAEPNLSEPLKVTKSEPTKFEKPEEIKLSKEKEIKLESILRRIIKEEISKKKVLREIYTKDDLKFVDGKAVIKKGNKVIAKIYDRPVFYKINNLKSSFSPKYPVSLEVNGMSRECESIEDALSALNRLLFENLNSINELEVSDPDIVKKIEEMARLSDEMDRLKNELDKLKKLFTPLDKEITELMDKADANGHAALETNTVLVTIKKKGYEAKSPKYKESFEELYKRVNAAMKKQADELLAANTDMKKYSTTLAVQYKKTESVVNEETIVTRLLNKVKNYFSNIFNSLTKREDEIDLGVERLKKFSNL